MRKKRDASISATPQTSEGVFLKAFEATGRVLYQLMLERPDKTSYTGAEVLDRYNTTFPEGDPLLAQVVMAAFDRDMQPEQAPPWRSEERRVGKEGRSGVMTDPSRKK